MREKIVLLLSSPHRANVVDLTNTDTQTDNLLLDFFSALSLPLMESLIVVISIMYDRFNNKFRYIPCNADVAGLMTRTNVNCFPWFSPAGQQSGIINNAVKLCIQSNKGTKRFNSILQRINPYYSTRNRNDALW